MKRLSERQSRQIRNLVLIIGVMTTLTFWTSLSDPISLPKMLFLLIMSAWVLGMLTPAILANYNGRVPLEQVTILFFVVGVLVAAMLTDVHYTAFFGAAQRNNGALSYIALSILFLAATVGFEVADLPKFRYALLALGAVLSMYGVLQFIGRDPLKWNLIYGPVIGTLGNPDFMSAVVGVSAIATVWFIIIKGEMSFRIIGIFLLLAEIFVARKTGSIQGLLAFSLGTSVLIIAKLWQTRKSMGIGASIFFGAIAIPVFLGLLNKGPLASHLFRSSLRNRFDYWQAAISMFKAHLFFGVGLDRFFESYGQYAPKVQVVQGQITNNAHNVFLQLLATGGLVVFLPYFFLLGSIFFLGVKAIRRASGKTQLDLVAIFSIWFALVLISIISIDNLGVSVWMWISGGVLVGASRTPVQGAVKKSSDKKRMKSKSQEASSSSDLIVPIISTLLSVIMLVVAIPIWNASLSVASLQRFNGGLTQAEFAGKINQMASTKGANVQVLVALTDVSLRASEIDLALSIVKKINQKDPRSIPGLNYGAIANEMGKKFPQAIPYRIRLLVLDPWNTQNMLQLTKDYLAIKDKVRAVAIFDRMFKLYPTSADAKAAAALVKG